ncbi:MAG: hypothetical protein RLY57_71 [Candidatus Parcubacteria bacterium]|jgi:hypothetical protein
MLFSTGITDHVSKRDLDLYCHTLGVVTKARAALEKHPHHKKLSFECHSICRALAKVIPELTLVDGHYLGLRIVNEEGEKRVQVGTATHSWFCTPDDSIIDPYPVGYLTPSPVLVVNRGPYKPFGGDHYIPLASVTREISNRELFRKTQILYSIIR